MRFYCIIENRVPRSSSKLWPTGREISKPNCLLGHAEWWANSPRYVLSALWVLRDDVHKAFSSKSLNSRYTMLYTLSLYIPLGDFSRNPVNLFYAFLLYNRVPRNPPKLWPRPHRLCEMSFKIGFPAKVRKSAKPNSIRFHCIFRSTDVPRCYLQISPHLFPPTTTSNRFQTALSLSPSYSFELFTPRKCTDADSGLHNSRPNVVSAL